MPILPPEPFLFPEDLLARGPSAAAEPQRWWVLHTRPRAEKALARRCLGRETAFFLPLCRRQTRTRGRLFTSHVPLFPSYLFLFADEPSRVQVLATNLVTRCLPVPDQAKL